MSYIFLLKEGKGMITEGAGELRETKSNTDITRGTDGSGTHLASCEEIGMLKTNNLSI